MRIDRAGTPFILGALVSALVLMAVGLSLPSLALLVLAGLFLFFFRDPERRPPGDPAVAVAPADGRVMHAGEADPAVTPSGRWLQVSIFLSPLDVHVNRTPVAGTVTDVIYTPGRFLAAYRREAAAENERSEVHIVQDGRTVVCRQVVGVLARRVVCRLVPGMVVRQGQRLGIMKFGSRMDVFLPPDSTVCVTRGERVRGGETVIARFEPAQGLPPEETVS